LRTKNKKYNTALSGFTIMDVLVAMIIGGIVITMAMTYFIHLQKYLTEENKKGNTDTQYNLLESALTNDFHNANVIRYNNKYLEINGPLSAEYHFDTDYIIRSSGQHKDTFALVTKQCDVVYLSEKDNVISTIDVIIDLEKDLEYRVCLEKKYSALQRYKLQGIKE
jgi:type II secretory pathway pseudopilin PulG